MPVVVYVFSLCTFAFGFSEFVVAGLVSAIADDLNASIGTSGTAIAAYALGAAIGAPVVTALCTRWQDRSVLLVALCVLAIGSLAMALAPTIPILLATRFIVGLAHGLFMAVAADAAVKHVDKARAGRALSLVWVGLTLALALGVPLGTFLGSLWSWRIVFGAISVLGLLGMGGLILAMPRNANAADQPASNPLLGLRAIGHPVLLSTAIVGVLVSIATFTLFTFISPYLLTVTGVHARGLSMAMLAFGAASIAGNIAGGYLMDTVGAARSLPLTLALLALVLGGLYAFNAHPVPMVLLTGMLGMTFFCIVTLFTLHLLHLAAHHTPHATAVAAGLNIASFNLGTALGGAVGSMLIGLGSLVYLPLAGSVCALFAMALTLWLSRSSGIATTSPSVTSAATPAPARATGKIT